MKKRLFLVMIATLLLTQTSCSSTVEDTHNGNNYEETTTTTFEEQDSIEPINHNEEQTKLQDDIKSPDGATVVKLDPFEGLEVQFDGISPYLNYNINNSKCDPKIQQYVTYEVEEYDNLSNGDSLKVKAVLNCSDPTQIDFELSVDEREYEVTGMPEYVTDFSKVDTTSLDSEIQQYMDSHYMYSSHDGDVLEQGKTYGQYWSGDGLMGIRLEKPLENFVFDHFIRSELITHYQAVLKANYIGDCTVDSDAGNLSEKNTFNYYFVKYENKYAVKETSNTGDVVSDQKPVITVYIRIKNVISYPDGTLKYDIVLDHNTYTSDETGYFDSISSKGDKYNINEII